VHFSTALLLTAMSGLALAAAFWLSARWLAGEHARLEELVIEQQSLANLERTVQMWRDSIAEWRNAESPETRREAHDAEQLVALEILAQVEQLTEGPLFQEHRPHFGSIVRDAGLVSERFGAARPDPEIDPATARVTQTLALLDTEADRRVGLARESVRTFERRLGWGLAVLCGVYGLGVLLQLRWTRRRVLAPIGELTGAARTLLNEQGEEMPALPSAAAELGELSTAFGALVRRMREAQRRAEAADRAKSQFLANMSHEIRTPMMLILGYADQLMEPSELERAEPEQRAALESIRSNGDYLLQILNDLLDLSKVEAGRLAIQRTRVAPADVVWEVRALMQMRAREAKLSLEVEHSTDLPGWIETDPTRLRQILINLVGNAIKFTERGTIRLRVGMLDGKDEGRIGFDVIDTGIGMSEDEIARVFLPFVQADSSSTRSYAGAGLGLSICQRLAELLDGQIEVESKPGAGSRFRISLPVRPPRGTVLLPPQRERPSARTDAVLDPEPALSCRVLLVEDGAATALLVERMLSRAGASVEVARHGREALERVRDAREPFDLVLMDMQMPILDGYSAARALRSQGYRSPIVALTAHAMAEEHEACLRAGCDDVITKPVDRSTLVRVLARHMDRALQAATQVATRSAE
jgi:signal transduction histidine kinase/ActR/RegA family two-component response regulator